MTIDRSAGFATTSGTARVIRTATACPENLGVTSKAFCLAEDTLRFDYERVVEMVLTERTIGDVMRSWL